MAYQRSAKLLGAVRRSARALGIGATWKSGLPLSVADDFLYELYLLFEVVAALRSGHVVKYLPGAGAKANQFPRKPAEKKDRPRFDVYDKAGSTLLYQLCAGTTVKDLFGCSRGVDLSVQTAYASDQPSFQDLAQIYEAKYRVEAAGRITRSEFAQFAMWVYCFGLRGRPAPNLNLGHMGYLNANCLTTNGQFSTEPDTVLAGMGVREVCRLGPRTSPLSRG